MRRRCPCWSRPCGHAATRTATSRRSWERTSSACSVPLGDPFLGAPQAVADAALERVGGALDQEAPGRRRQNVVAVQREPPLLDVDTPHPPEERLAGRGVGFVLHLGELRQGAARARHLGVQQLHDGEPAAAERLDPPLRPEAPTCPWFPGPLRPWGRVGPPWGVRAVSGGFPPAAMMESRFSLGIGGGSSPCGPPPPMKNERPAEPITCPTHVEDKQQLLGA